jgi:U4/U6.U5 tri-snRNP component SNU23
VPGACCLATPAGMSSSGTFVKNVQRREWDLSEFEAKAASKRAAEEEAEALKDAKGRNQARKQQQLVVRQPLQHRSVEMKLDSRVGKHHLVTASSTLAQQGGYYCDICDCLLKDSSTYLDHVNGKKHQRALGMTLRAERSTLGDVKAKFEEHRRTQQDQAESGANELERRLQRFQSSLARDSADRASEKAAEKLRRKEQESRVRAAEREIAQGMGQTTSESRKRKQKPASSSEATATDEAATEDGQVEEADENDDDEDAASASDPKAKKAKSDSTATPASSTTAAATGEEEDPEQAMMRAMGFGGFASSKK